ncbi:hypothetical protein JCM15415_07840 [Methanobacterium movens]
MSVGDPFEEHRTIFTKDQRIHGNYTDSYSQNSYNNVPEFNKTIFNSIGSV